MVKILHVSDTHLGFQYGSDLRRQDYKDAFQEAIDIAIEKDVDAVVHSGDLFDSPNPSINVFNDALEVLSSLEEHDIMLYGIVGNHERKRDRQWLDIYERLSMAKRLSKEPIKLEDDNLEVSLFGIDAVRSPWWDSTDLSLEDRGSDYNLLAMHELLTPPVPEHMADYDLKEVLNRVGIDLDILLLGDYHERTTTEVDGVKAIYPGSTEKTSLSESPDHYVYLYELTPDKVTREHIGLKEPRPFIHRKVDLKENDGITKVEMEIDSKEYVGEGKTPVLVVELVGNNDTVTPREIKSKYNEEYALVRVKDNRDTVNINRDELSEVENIDIQTRIDNKVEENDFSDEVKKIKSLAEDQDLAKSHVRPEVRALLEEGDDNES